MVDDVMIRQAQKSDVAVMVSLSHQKRRSYEKAHPQFWRYATGAEDAQTKWFEELLGKHDHILLVAESKDKLLGFVIGRLMSSPEVYDPGGFTLMIDDFCVESLPDWAVVGKNLFSRIKELAKSKGVVQIVAVTGHHDERKRQFLQSLGLTIASEWYVGGLE